MIVGVKDDNKGKPLLTCVGGLVDDSDEYKYTSGGVISIVDSDFEFDVTVFLSIGNLTNSEKPDEPRIKSDFYVDSITPDGMSDTFEEHREIITGECKAILTKKINDFSGLNF